MLGASASMLGKTLGWEQIADTVNSEWVGRQGSITDAESAVSIFVKDHVVYLATEDPVVVSIHTILGHTLGENELKPGTYRLTLPQRGIYIIKAGTKILRITI